MYYDLDDRYSRAKQRSAMMAGAAKVDTAIYINKPTQCADTNATYRRVRV